MSTQPEALLALADRIEEAQGKPIAIEPQAAAELRRLHEANQGLLGLLEALESLLEMTGEPPDWNCTCHLTPPCIDCVDYSGWRNAFKFATSVLVKATGEQP